MELTRTSASARRTCVWLRAVCVLGAVIVMALPVMTLAESDHDSEPSLPLAQTIYPSAAPFPITKLGEVGVTPPAVLSPPPAAPFPSVTPVLPPATATAVTTPTATATVAPTATKPPSTATVAPPATATKPPLTATAPPTAPPTPRPPTATPGPTAGLQMIGNGPAAFYDPSFDSGGWDAIIRAQIRFGHVDVATFAYSPQGYYCVHPDYRLGAIFVLQNPRTGKTIRCTVADAVDHRDVTLWRSRWHVEMSYAAFTALGLRDGENIVAVYA